MSLCACSGTSTNAAGSTGSSNSTQVASSTGSDKGTTVGGVPITSIPDAMCVFVDRENLKLASVTPAAAAKAKFASDYKDWVKKDKDRKVTKTEFDGITKAHCPKVRSRLLHTVSGKTLIGLIS